jgi:hypothetical protein
LCYRCEFLLLVLWVFITCVVSFYYLCCEFLLLLLWVLLLVLWVFNYLCCEFLLLLLWVLLLVLWVFITCVVIFICGVFVLYIFFSACLFFNLFEVTLFGHRIIVRSRKMYLLSVLFQMPVVGPNLANSRLIQPFLPCSAHLAQSRLFSHNPAFHFSSYLAKYRLILLRDLGEICTNNRHFKDGCFENPLGFFFLSSYTLLFIAQQFDMMLHVTFFLLCSFCVKF